MRAPVARPLAEKRVRSSRQSRFAVALPRADDKAKAPFRLRRSDRSASVQPPGCDPFRLCKTPRCYGVIPPALLQDFKRRPAPLPRWASESRLIRGAPDENTSGDWSDSRIAPLGQLCRRSSLLCDDSLIQDSGFPYPSQAQSESCTKSVGRQSGAGLVSLTPVPPWPGSAAQPRRARDSPSAGPSAIRGPAPAQAACCSCPCQPIRGD